MEEKEWVRWENIEKTIDKKIKKIREQEKEIEDPVTMSFLQVHEEILHTIRDELKDLKKSDLEIE